MDRVRSCDSRVTTVGPAVMRSSSISRPLPPRWPRKKFAVLLVGDKRKFIFCHCIQVRKILFLTVGTVVSILWPNRTKSVLERFERRADLLHLGRRTSQSGGYLLLTDLICHGEKNHGKNLNYSRGNPYYTVSKILFISLPLIKRFIYYVGVDFERTFYAPT